MLDYQRIVDDVRSSLDSHADDGMDFLRAAAADYSIACEELNERLHHCADLLRKGLRSEAIQLSDIESNLLDVVALLDFPEREQWIETSERCGIAPPTPLLLEVAAELNEAYGLEQPLAALLQRHRLLAMAHAPLPARIDVLRRLEQMDPGSPVWPEDLRTFEEERQKQLRGEVEAAERAGDVERLAALDAELASPNWKNPPPPPLAHSANVAHTRLRYWVVQSELDELATELEAARSGFHLDFAHTFRDRWDEIIATSGWQPQEPIADRAAPVLRWLAEQDDFDRKRQAHEEAVGQLMQAIHHGRVPRRLVELHNRAAELGPLPAELEQPYENRLTALRRAARLRWWLQCAGLTAAAVAIAVMLALLISRQWRAGEIDRAIKDINAFVEADQLDKADAYVHGLAEPVKQDAGVRAAIDRLQAKLNRGKSRQRQFADKLAAAQRSLEQALKSLDSQPGQTVLDRLGTELDYAHDGLDGATKLAVTTEDHEKVDSALEFAAQVKDKWQHQLDDAFLKRYADVDGQITQIAHDNQSDAKTLKTQIDDCNSRLQEWEGSSSRVTPALLQRIATLRERLTDLTGSVKKQEQAERDQQRITAAIGVIPTYIEALQTAIHHNPSAECAAGFKRAIDESSCWQAVTEWSNMAQKFNQTGIVGLRPTAAEQQAALAETAVKNFADCAECEGLRAMMPYLKAVARRDNNGERIDAPIKKLFADPLVADLWMVETDDGRRYYVSSQPQPGDPLKCIVAFDGKTRGKTLTPSEWEKAKIMRAPQTLVAEQVKPVLKALDDNNWERSFCRIIAILAADRAMDPILKANLLQQVIEAGVRGSYCLDKAFGPHTAWFNDARFNAFANWLDPDDRTAYRTPEEARRKAAKALADMPEIEGPRQAAAKDFAALRGSRVAEYRWVGWLLQTRDGHWKCPMNQMPDSGGRLLVVCRRGAGERLMLATVGRLDHQEVTIDTTAPSLLVDGRPVYLAIP